jgi:hypothetical protein
VSNRISTTPHTAPTPSTTRGKTFRAPGPLQRCPNLRASASHRVLPVSPGLPPEPKYILQKRLALDAGSPATTVGTMLLKITQMGMLASRRAGTLPGSKNAQLSVVGRTARRGGPLGRYAGKRRSTGGRYRYGPYVSAVVRHGPLRDRAVLPVREGQTADGRTVEFQNNVGSNAPSGCGPR